MRERLNCWPRLVLMAIQACAELGLSFRARSHDSAFRVRRGIQPIECRSGRIKLGCPGQVTRELPDQLRAEPPSDAEQSVARGGAVNGHVAGRADAWPIVAIKGPAQTDNELEISKF
jgi:hypothetical protein